MNPVFIYALNCPTSGRTRYIGKAVDPRRRFSCHLSPSELGKNNHRANWIRSLKAQGLQPILEIIDEIPEEHWQQWEVAYIEFFREQGCDLVNGTAGGDGVSGRKGRLSPLFGKRPSLETRKKLSASKQGEKHPMFGKKHSPETLTRQSAVKLGIKNSRNTSGFVGVYWHTPTRKWCSLFRPKGKKQVHVGLFQKIEDAVLARALALEKEKK